MAAAGFTNNELRRVKQHFLPLLDCIRFVYVLAITTQPSWLLGPCSLDTRRIFGG